MNTNQRKDGIAIQTSKYTLKQEALLKTKRDVS